MLSEFITPMPLEIKRPQQKIYKQFGSMPKKRGLTLWEYDRATRQIQAAPIQSTQATAHPKLSYYDSPESSKGERERGLGKIAGLLFGQSKQKETPADRLEPKKGCIYIWALNKENALRKINKSLQKHQK